MAQESPGKGGERVWLRKGRVQLRKGRVWLRKKRVWARKGRVWRYDWRKVWKRRVSLCSKRVGRR